MTKTYNLRRDTLRVKQLHDSDLEPVKVVWWGVIVEVGGSVFQADMGENYTWVSLFNMDETPPHLAFNPTALKEAGTAVQLSRTLKTPYRWQVTGTYTETLTANDTTPLNQFEVGNHAENHQNADESDPGPDVVSVFQPMLMMLKTEGDGTTLTVSTHPFTYTQNGTLSNYGGQDTDLTSYVPGVGLIRKVLFYLDRDTNVLTLVSGTAVTDDGITPIPDPVVPDGTHGEISGWVTLANGQTDVTTADDVEDGRTFLGADVGGSTLPTPTRFGEILMYDDGGIIWALPVVDANGDIVTDIDGTIVYT